MKALARVPAWAWVTLILLSGLVLRLNGLTSTPAPTQNRDELAWAWAGQSLIQDHSPSSWSYLSSYGTGDTRATFDGTIMPYVHPWLDHPPLFALLVGGVAIAAGENTPASVTPGVIRLIPIVASLVTILLLFALASRLVGRRWALLAVVLFAFSPWMIEMSHAVEAESILAPMLLGALLLVDRKGKRALAGLVAICLLAPLVKVVGVTIGATVAVLFLLRRHWARSALSGAAGLAGVGLYWLYGFAINRAQFLAVWHAQSTRHASALAAGWQFLTSTVASLGGFIPLHDPLWFAGLLAIVVLVVFRGDMRLAVPVIVYVAVMAVTGADTPVIHSGVVMRQGNSELTYNSGWYRITIYPLLYIAIAGIIPRVGSRLSFLPRDGRGVPRLQRRMESLLGQRGLR